MGKIYDKEEIISELSIFSKDENKLEDKLTDEFINKFGLAPLREVLSRSKDGHDEDTLKNFFFKYCPDPNLKPVTRVFFIKLDIILLKLLRNEPFEVNEIM